MPRIYTPGLSAHVIRRGINRCVIFHDDADRHVFLTILKEAAREEDTSVHGLVLMSTHYHALVTPGHAEGLADTMKTVGERYVDYFNRKYGRIGTLWTGRYRAIPIESERYWLNCLRYIEQNPVRARMVAAPGDYPWSSYRHHAFGVRTAWLTEHPLYRALGKTAQERRAVYRSACEIPLTDEELALQRRPPIRRLRGRPQITLASLTEMSDSSI